MVFVCGVFTPTQSLLTVLAKFKFKLIFLGQFTKTKCNHDSLHYGLQMAVASVHT